MVLSKQSLIHSNSGQIKIKPYLKLLLVVRNLRTKTNEINLFQKANVFQKI